MAYTTLLADGGETVTQYVQQGNIPGVQIVSGSNQRLGSRQPMFYQSGRAGTRVDIVVMRAYLDLPTALIDRTLLEGMAGQRVVVSSQHGEEIETFFHSVRVEVKAGAGPKYLVTARINCEAMPTTITEPTTP